MANNFFKGLDKPKSFLDIFIDNFDKLDVNNDYKVSKFENIFKIKFTIGLNKIFSTLDKNNDGYLTVDEIKSSQHDEENLFKINFYTKWLELDENKDGFLSILEAQKSKALPKHFALIDSNKDNKLSKNELIAYYNQEIVKFF